MRQISCISRLSAGIALVALAACTTTPDWPTDGALDQAAAVVGPVDPRVTVHRKTKEAWDSSALPDERVQPLMRELLVPALLSNAVYHREFADDSAGRIAGACRYVSGDPGWPALQTLPPGWVRVTEAHIKAWGLSLARESLCLSGKGLAYELYALTNAAGTPVELVLAFRGTENDGDQRWPDWAANLSQVDFGSDEDPSFTGAQETAVAVVEAFRKVLPAIAPTGVCSSRQPDAKQLPISFVGHSLGGGLAQHAAYAVSPCDATRAVTFNTSPVTGWFYLKNRCLIKNPDPIIVRAYNDREILAYLRGLTIRFNFARENRVDYQLAFRDFTRQRHSMANLAYWIERSSAGVQSTGGEGLPGLQASPQAAVR